MLSFKKNIPQLVALSVSLVCLVLYLPALTFDFVSFDDPDYVLNNPIIRQLGPETFTRAFLDSYLGWWMPLTWISLAVDHHLWGLNPLGYHLTNIVLHALNAGVAVLIADAVIRRAPAARPGPGSPYVRAGILLAAGLFFGAHPLRVESVAWVTERKDVLNGLFTFLSVLFYLRYVEKKGNGSTGGGAGIFYACSLVCFVCSLMAKSVSVVLPVIMLVLDWVPLARHRDNSLRRLFLEKWPFWLTSVLMTVFTLFFAAQSQYLVTYEVFPLTQRMAVSGNALWEYISMLLFPVNLSPLNIIPDPIPFSYLAKTVMVAIGLTWVGFVGRKRAPRLTACLCCFILPLLPVLAFFQNGDQSYADRFTYLPSLWPAVFLALVLYDSPRLAQGIGRNRFGIMAAVLVTAIFMTLTYRQLDVWRSTETFWSRVIDVEPLAISYKERGRYYHGVGRYAEAVADFNAALKIIPPTLKPYEFNFYAFRAESLRAAGLFAEAVDDFNTAIRLHPHPVYFFHRGLALQAMGRNGEAEEDFRSAGPDPGPINWID